MTITKEKIKEKLRKHLKREPKDDEVENGKKDIAIIQEIQDDEIEAIKVRLVDLEKKIK